MFSKHRDVLLLIVRLIIGGIFVAAGYLKASDMANTVNFFGQLGFAAFLAYVVTAIELVGGAAILVGFRTDIAASTLAVIMLVAVYSSLAGGFAGVMPPLAVLSGLLSLLASGAGAYAVRHKR